MSGGSLDFVYWRLEEASKALHGEVGKIVPAEGFSSNDKSILTLCAVLMGRMSGVAHDVEWVLSGDYGHDDIEKEVVPQLRAIRDLLVKADLGDSNG